MLRASLGEGDMTTDIYLFGRTAAELARLARQAALVEPETEELFIRAGITSGMHVLEIGSGAGDVAILAGRLVRPDGSVLGVEGSPASAELANHRALAAANVGVRVEVGDLNTYQPSRSFDALIGRFILPYLADPAGTLRRLSAHVRPGGAIAFMEFDVTRIESVPKMRLFTEAASWIMRAFEGSGISPSFGSSLGSVFRDAGLPWPYMTSFQKASCGPAGTYWLLAETVRTLLPQIVALGIATGDEVDIDTLFDRLREEAVAARATVYSPRWVGAWANLPVGGSASG
jgi:SAM-dependent methyltransferase